VAENVYLTTQRKAYEGLRSSIEGLQTRAAEANRGLTEDELRSIAEMKAQGDKLYTEIETLTDVELRSAKVATMQANVQAALRGADGSGNQGPTGGDTELRNINGSRPTGGATTQDRDPGHYRSLQEGGQRSFFGDLYAAREKGDTAAATRLQEHNRALTTGSAGAGVVAPKWLVDEYAALARQGRVLANAVRNIPLGDDPRPMTLPKQTAGADTEVTEQAAENDPIEDDDAWASSVDTVTPKPTAGVQIVSRQMLDMSSPAIDTLLYGDLIAAYNLKVEKKVGTAIIAVGTALPAAEPGTDTDGVLITDKTHYARVFIKAAIAVRNARKLPANLAAMSVNRWGEFLDLVDSTGRPLVTGVGDGPTNIMGAGDVSSMDGGRFRGVPLAPTDGIALDDRFVLLRSSDVLLFESNLLRFRYEQPLGPESIKMGIWGYTAVLVRYGTASIKRVEITADNTP
jgi:HK97 family phage major capsid protein